LFTESKAGFIQMFLLVYDLALWKYYSATALNKLRSAYNKCIKIMFNFSWRRDSVTSLFMELSPSHI